MLLSSGINCAYLCYQEKIVKAAAEVDVDAAIELDEMSPAIVAGIKET